MLSFLLKRIAQLQAICYSQTVVINLKYWRGINGMRDQDVVVLGAGIVGVSCALALQEKGARVTLIDRNEPGSETSHGNSGVIGRNLMIPHNNPKLWGAIPKYVGNASVQVRYDVSYMLRHVPWIFRYLGNTKRKQFTKTAKALDSLISTSIPLHEQWISESGAQHHLHDSGCLHLYRTKEVFSADQWVRDFYKEYGIAYEELNADRLHELEPFLKQVFPHATWVKDALSVDDPRAVVRAYARLFTSRGGVFVRKDVRRISRTSEQNWLLQSNEWDSTNTQHLVVAIGSWAKEMLLPLGIRIPLAFERGYHQHFLMEDAAKLYRPVYDFAGGYVASSMRDGFLRMSTGVELNDLQARKNTDQLEMAEVFLRDALPVKKIKNEEPWIGSRSTLPDACPLVGEVPEHKGLWLATGHQHIGLTTGPGTGQLMAALMCGEKTEINSKPFAPERYL